MEITIGRSSDCEIVILDPKNRVSRKHAMLKSSGNDTFIKDIGSANGTYINGIKISTGEYQKLNKFDKVTLAMDYVFDFNLYIKKSADDDTLVLNSSINNKDSTVIFDKDRVTVTNNDRTVMFDPNKTVIADLSEMDRSPYKKLGRSSNNDFFVDNINVSREHCQIRLLTPVILEIEDLGSANGTYADGTKLEAGKKYKYSSSVNIGLSKSYSLDLKQVFPGIQIVRKGIKQKAPSSGRPNPKAPITTEEKVAFMELEELWEEFSSRNDKANKMSQSYGMGGAAAGLAAIALIPGIGQASIAVMGGVGLIARYIGQKKSNEIRSDLSYENVFLEMYCCPRCKESFQRKPWITIRDCFKCKLSFR